MPRKLTREEFIEKAKLVHGNKYDYSKVKYENTRTKVCIICSNHGIFFQLPKVHLNGVGCKLCGYEHSKSKIHNFGINDTLFETKSHCYKIWCSMIGRCYYEKYKKNKPTYIDCTVCDEWKYFSNFKKWFDKNYIDGYELDKDIIIKGNKVYSPETCCFVPQEINSVFKNRINRLSNLPKGVIFSDSRLKYKAQIMEGFKRKYLGYFDTPELAFNAYKKAKESYIKEVANKWKDKIAPKVYEAMMKYEVEYTIISYNDKFEEPKKQLTSMDMLTAAIYTNLYLNDCATNLIKDIEYDIKFKDKETRKIYGALKRRINIYQHEIHDIVGDNKAEFFANFNEAMDDTFMPLINDIKKEILKSYVEHDIDDADYLSMVEIARFMTEYSCKVNINCVRDMYKLTDKAVSLRSYRLTELNQIMENFANWSYRNCPFFNLNDQSEVLNKFHILDNAIGEIQNTLNAIEVANKYIGE